MRKNTDTHPVFVVQKNTFFTCTNVLLQINQTYFLFLCTDMRLPNVELPEIRMNEN